MANIHRDVVAALNDHLSAAPSLHLPTEPSLALRHAEPRVRDSSLDEVEKLFPFGV